MMKELIDSFSYGYIFLYKSKRHKQTFDTIESPLFHFLCNSQVATIFTFIPV